MLFNILLHVSALFGYISMNYALLFYTNSGALRELDKAPLVGAQNYMIEGCSFIPIFMKTHLEKPCCDWLFNIFS